MSLLSTLHAALHRPAFVQSEAGGKSGLSGEQAGPGKLPAAPPTKAPNKAVSIPSFKTQVARSTSVLQRTDSRIANTDITTFRTNGDTRQVVRQYVASNPDLSASVNAYLRVGIPDRYTVIARDMDGMINVEGTQIAQEMLRRITFLGDVSLGYNPSTDLKSLSESLAKELLTYGAMGLELALDKQRIPLFLQPVSVTKIQFKEEEGGVYPVQVLGGVERSLDIPTFFYLSLDQDLLTAYATSPLEPAIQAVLADAQFLNDLRKSMQRVIQPRLVATLIEEKVLASAPPEVANDPEKLGEFYTTLITNLTTMLSGLNPEDALISSDSVTFSYLKSEGGGGNIAETLEMVQKLIEGKLAAGAKTHPSVLGRESNGSAATASSMLFLKNANMVRSKLNTLYSRMLTQAVRLMGQDVFVEFEYEELDLRPKAELEAYASMRQSRILTQLSLGFITDEDASILLTGNLPPAGHKPLSGTMFMTAAPAGSANPDSQTSNMNEGGAPDGQKPTTPAAPKS